MRILFLSALLLGLTVTAEAHKGATGVVKMRMDSMGVAKDAVADLAKIAGGQSTYSATAVSALAAQIADEMTAAPGHFTQRDLSPPTEALPILWDEMDRFADLARRSADAANAVAETETLDAMRPALLSLGQTCTDCHDRYRQIKP